MSFYYNYALWLTEDPARDPASVLCWLRRAEAVGFATVLPHSGRVDVWFDGDERQYETLQQAA